MTGRRGRDYVDLTKPRITGFVVLTAALGYWLGSGAAVDLVRLCSLLMGTALVSGGTNALNQWWERDIDARMPRTRRRPVASGRLPPRRALLFGIAIGIGGTVLLFWGTNALTGTLAALTLASYVFVYTPLKQRSALNVFIGSVPGALPIMGGWAAASGRLDPTAWLLFGLLYLWQLPHTLALAWMLRDEYRVAGLRMAGGDDPLGRRTAFRGVMAGVALLVASLALAPSGTPGWVYGGTALAIGLFLIAAMGAWMRCPSVRSARRAFLATLAYLPAVLFVLGLTSIFRSP